jgi:hypothetical protein
MEYPLWKKPSSHYVFEDEIAFRQCQELLGHQCFLMVRKSGLSGKMATVELLRVKLEAI